MSEGQSKKKRLYCNTCKAETNHDLKGTHTLRLEDDDWGQEFAQTTYNLWICAGCETGTMEREYTDSDTLEEDAFGDLQQAYECSYYPKRAREDLVPKRFVKLGPKLSRIYRETISCYNTTSLVLCGAGLRALLEGICEDKHIKGRNLTEKINGLQALLPNKHIIRRLHHFRFTGNKAVHKLEASQAADVKLAIEVMEDLLNFLYELDYKASRLGQRPKKIKFVLSPAATVPPALAAQADEGTKPSEGPPQEAESV